ncbi:phospholipase D-like domain-containing protein [Propioniciclava soli]|uniref:phospholipase D-like domain-containing protein n=1 Tax=Propioniciclava soli TaxID=2775081 RepID=UPI001E39A93A|nr:phospholipase D-like domain-containing protein [Propioniciclava soli]
MVARRVRTAIRVAVGTGFAAQAATIAGLAVVDRRRKRDRRDVGFPSAPPVDVALPDIAEMAVFTRGSDLFDAMVEAIDGATERILFETYIWKADAEGQRFKDALTRAARRGVEVHVVYDWFANLVVPQHFFSFDRRVTVMPHQPWTGLRGRVVRSPGLNHRKILVVDGRDAFVGGYNIGSLYATAWRDTHLRVRGPAAAELENAFVDYWNGARGRRHAALPQPPARLWHSTFSVVRNVPSVGVYPIRYMYLEAIDRARDHIWLTHAYLIPDDDLVIALTDAAARGVDVRVIVPAASNHIVADWLSRGFYRTLLRGGVRLFLYRGTMVHAKTATIDGIWSTIGTANLDSLSLIGNYEVNAQVIDEALAAEMEQLFHMDAAQCRELTLDRWSERSLIAKVSEAILAPLRPLL